MNCKMHLKTHHIALLALQYQYKFNLFFSAKWLFAQLTLIYYNYTGILGSHTHTHTHMAIHSSHSTREKSYTVVSESLRLLL